MSISCRERRMAKPSHSGSGWFMKSPRLPQLAMKVQSKMTSYGVVPLVSLDGAAPGPVPRTDPSLATGEACRKDNVGQSNQKPKNGQSKESSNLNIVQFNLGGFGKKRQNLLISLTYTISILLFFRKPRKGKTPTLISPSTRLLIVNAINVKEPLLI